MTVVHLHLQRLTGGGAITDHIDSKGRGLVYFKRMGSTTLADASLPSP